MRMARVSRSDPYVLCRGKRAAMNSRWGVACQAARHFSTVVLSVAMGAVGGCTHGSAPNDELLGAASSCEIAKAHAALAAGAEANARINGSTALNVAAQFGCTEVAKLLITSGADVNAGYTGLFPNLSGQTALMQASRGNIELVNILLAAHADVNAKEGDGETALGEAASGATLTLGSRG